MTIIALLIAGIFLGRLLRPVKILRHLDKSTTLTVWILIFVFGLTLGANPSISEDIGRFGLKAAAIALSGVAGSVAAVWLYSRKANKSSNDER